MGYIKYACDVSAPVDVAFAYTDNPLAIPHWMFGVTDCTPHEGTPSGQGALFTLRFRFLLWRLVLTCEIVEYRHDAVIGYAIRSRLNPRLTLRFDPLGPGRSVLTSELNYAQPGGIIGRLADRGIYAILGAALRRSESHLRREIEEFHGTDIVGRVP
ncbi:SRPBCC family protein [Nocardia paucivorans]|uniref:SRPBCC family protein n=1 Tax=Nocardia paucivorans TaxID=114259 RepID=UPI00031EF41D|nr:SRPBCC family protein [Nocardia paucivorans]